MKEETKIVRESDSVTKKGFIYIWSADDNFLKFCKNVNVGTKTVSTPPLVLHIIDRREILFIHT